MNTPGAEMQNIGPTCAVTSDQTIPTRRLSPRVRILGWLCALYLKLSSLTWFKKQVGHERLEQMIQDGERLLFAFWHGKYVPLFVVLQGRPVCVATSLSFRGDVIRAICSHFGYACIQLPDHGGFQAFESMKSGFSLSQIAAIAVDGPTGPYHVVKHGAIRMASDLGFKLMPVSVAARRKKVLAHRWDHMEIPWPFSRVCVVFGEPFSVPPGVTAADMAACSQRLHDAIVAVDQYAERRLAAH
ncbi:MAG: DUF374 domain-containing protein [Planctomycetaceae bacterium]